MTDEKCVTEAIAPPYSRAMYASTKHRYARQQEVMIKKRKPITISW